MSPRIMYGVLPTLALALSLSGCNNTSTTQPENPEIKPPVVSGPEGEAGGAAEPKAGEAKPDEGKTGATGGDGGGGLAKGGQGQVDKVGEGTEPKPEDEPKTAADFLRQAQKAGSAGDLDKALAIVEKGVNTVEKADPQLLTAFAQLANAQAMRVAQADRSKANPLFYKAADAFRLLAKSHGGEFEEFEKSMASNAFYNEACAFATDGKATEAIAAVKAAISIGFNDFKLLETDPDMASLQTNEELKKLVGEAKMKLAKAAQEEARKELAAAKSFPFEFALPNLDDKQVASADFKGKVLIVDIWGTWCPPCRMEIPHFIALHKKYKEKGLEIVGINYERVAKSEWKPLIKQFVEEMGVTYACVLGDEETQGRVPNLEGFPTTIFMDRTGKVRLKIVGYHEYSKLEAIVEELLAEKAPAPPEGEKKPAEAEKKPAEAEKPAEGEKKPAEPADG